MVTGRAAQRRRLVLLARLALAHGTPLTRDLLCGLFWAESRQEQARQSLSAALYDLRRLLGEAALPASGEDVWLDASLVACDAVMFEDAVAAGRLEEAASLYCGPLLEGVYFGARGAEEWERWVDAERARLARIYATVLERLAGTREAAGDAAGTLEALLSLSREDPFGARTVMRLMNALNRSGERARAIRQARVYASRIRTELDAEPDPAVLELAGRLQREPASEPTSATASERASAAGPEPVSATASEPASVAGADLPLARHGGGAPSRKVVVAPGAAVDEAEPSPPRRPPLAPLAATRARGRTSRLRAAILAGAIIVAGAGGYTLYRAGSARGDVSAPTIAIVPFENLSPHRADQYFVDGVSDDLLTRMSRVPGLRVISRISTLRYRHTTKPVKEIGRELGASYLLEGSIQREGNRVRINAQLIDARKDQHVWAERYDRELSQIFNVQTEIAEAIAAALVTALLPEQKALLAAGGTSDPLAYDLYLRGQRAADAFAPDSAAVAFRQALAVDPAYALPHAALAWMYARSAHAVAGSGDSTVAEARRALELDPRSTLARRALAARYLALGRFVDAEQQIRAALRIDPNDVTAMNLLSWVLAAQRRNAEFLAVRIATFRLDPLNGETFYMMGWFFEKMGERDLAIRSERRAIELGYGGAYSALVQFYMFKGDLAAVRAVLDRMENVTRPDGMLALGTRAEMAARAGRWREAERLIQRPFEVSAESRLFPAYIALKLGQRARADSLLAVYERDVRQREAAGVLNLGARARLAAVRGDRPGAVALLRQMRAAGYSHCLPRPTLYFESLEGDRAYEAIRDEMCAEGARGRRELERTGKWAELLKAMGPLPAVDGQI